MGVHSGKFAVVNGQSTVRNWAINDTSSPQRYVASNTRGGSGRRPGNRDWSGSFAAYGATPLLLPGDDFTFSGYTAPTTDVGGTNGYVWTGPAITDQIAVSWNWGNGEILAYTLGLSGNGPLTKSAVAAPIDATDPEVPVVCGTKITYGNGDTEWPNLVQAVLTITAANQAFVNSSTNCWTNRKPGVIDWTLAVTEQNDEGLPAAIAIGADEEFKLWVNDAEFWHLQYGHVGEATGLTIDRESGNIIQRTVNIAMNAANPSIGKIRLPGAESDWWPFPG